MNDFPAWPAIEGHLAAERLTAELMLLADQLELDEFLQRLVQRTAQCLGGEALLYRAARGAWRRLAASEPAVEAPLDVLADALDCGRAAEQGDWLALPLTTAAGGELLALHRRGADKPTAAVAAAVAASLNAVRNLSRKTQRVQRLETMLQIAGRWRCAEQVDKLLEEMAEASTELLDAERASIFLWDRASRTLVGRPALGVEGGELRIPDDAGVVGDVVHSGQTRRVDADLEHDQGQINRAVDRQLEFQTRSLLCTPLHAADGKIIGAFEMINKREGNFSDDDELALVELAAHASVALSETQHYEQLLKRRQVIADQAAAHVQLIGECPAIGKLRDTITRVADTDLALLILGENGSGKEVVSQMVHYLSGRRNDPFVAVNCAALSETLLESELFGHEKGAFTDARETRTGKFEAASGGTLFLDEIGDMSLGGQSKLLRVLEEKVVVRVGGSQPIPTDARVIAATNQDLEQLVREKKFRQDLFFRLHVVPIYVPSLRERENDVLLLAEHFLRDFCVKARRPVPQFTAAARQALLKHSWPGNVRELRNVMERLAYLQQGDQVDATDLNLLSAAGKPNEAMLGDDSLTLTDATQDFQARYIQRHIDRCGGNMTEAAESLGLHRSNLYRKMRQLGMQDPA